MRLFLIIALLVASLGFVQPVSAQAHGEHAAHHAMGHGGDHGDTQGNDQSPQLTHVCPGCAAVGQPAVTEAEEPVRVLPDMPGNAPSLRSFNANPSPPPPRLS
jgi:hypothetical protein